MGGKQLTRDELEAKYPGEEPAQYVMCGESVVFEDLDWMERHDMSACAMGVNHRSDEEDVKKENMVFMEMSGRLYLVSRKDVVGEVGGTQLFWCYHEDEDVVAALLEGEGERGRESMPEVDVVGLEPGTVVVAEGSSVKYEWKADEHVYEGELVRLGKLEVAIREHGKKQSYGMSVGSVVFKSKVEGK